MAQFKGYLACPNEGCGYNSKLFLDGVDGELRCPAHEHADGKKCEEHKHRFLTAAGQGMRGWDTCPDCKKPAARYPDLEGDPDFERILCLCGCDHKIPRKAPPTPPLSGSMDGVTITTS